MTIFDGDIEYPPEYPSPVTEETEKPKAKKKEAPKVEEEAEKED